MDAMNVEKRPTFLGRLVDRHPYIAAIAVAAVMPILLPGISFLTRLAKPLLIMLGQYTFLRVTLLAELLVAIVVAVLIGLLKWWSEVGLTQGVTWKGVVICLIPLGLIVLPTLCGWSVEFARATPTVVTLAVVLVLAIGFVEEGVFRGLVLRILVRKGILVAAIGSSVLFSLIHLTNVISGFPWPYVVGQMIGAFGIGLLFAAVRLRTNSLWPSLLLHALRDVGGIILLATNPRLALSTSWVSAVIVNGVYAAFFILNAWVLLRPSQLRKLREQYGLVAPAPQTAGVPVWNGAMVYPSEQVKWWE